MEERKEEDSRRFHKRKRAPLNNKLKVKKGGE